MKATELMIGDLVIFEDNIHKITDLSLCIDESVLVHVDGYECNIFEHEISPIPLTEEILKANGFEKRDGHYANGISDCYYKNGFALSFREKFYIYCGMVSLLVNYVHELQHTIRICGLSDLADNLKIQE